MTTARSSGGHSDVRRPLLAGRSLLEYLVAWAGILVFALEVALMISIAVILVMFFPASPAAHRVVARADRGDAP